jgi:ATP-dependent DNA helicase RecQ
MMNQTPLEVLKKYFGYQEFRGNQEAVISCLLKGEDALVLMPTGGGKSLCYQIPSMLKPGVGVVVSPLISLMKDQVDSLLESGVRAAFVNSTMTYAEQKKVEEKALQQDIDLLYVAPERLNTSRFMDLLQRMEIALFAIDEAHCVSEWGHDFRPDYLQLGQLAQNFPHVPRVALTATADEIVRKEITAKLRLENSRFFMASFDRPNIFYRVVLKENGKNQMVRFLRNEHAGDSGIVYCLSRNKVDAIAAWLQKEGFNALPYHAGLSNQERQDNQQRFLMEDDLIIVATIAFGMGIDKPDVRFVVHLDLPKNLESYYQETGRAGRDGNPADAWMAYSLSDVVTLRSMMDQSDGSQNHKMIQRKKLEAILGFCEIVDCRRQALLNYFGETLAEPCGHCDTCVDTVESFDGTIVAQKALSCVYRTGERFGAKYLIDVLLGKDDTRIRTFQHDQLKTFGIGTELDRRGWNSVYRQLIATNKLQVDMEKMGGFKLNENSWKILKSGETVTLRKDPAPVSAKKKKKPAKAGKNKTVADDPRSTTLFEKLRAWRHATAREKELPSFTIFHDSTLWQIVSEEPTTDQQFLAISGVGQTKLERYGAAIMEIIAQFKQDEMSDTHSSIGDIDS